MRKVVVFNLVSVDGYIADARGLIDWHRVDDEFFAFSRTLFDSVDTLLFGRVTYDLMARYWPTEAGRKDDPAVARLMNSLSKVVFSSTMKDAGWENARVVPGGIEGEVARLKGMPGGNLLVLGSGTIVGQLTAAGLVDQFNLVVNPVLLAGGRPGFPGLRDRVLLRLVSTRPFKSGNVLLTYEPEGARRASPTP